MTPTFRPRRLAAALLLSFAAGGSLCWAHDHYTRRCCAPVRPLPMSEAVRGVLPSVLSLELEDKAGARSFAAAMAYRADGLLVTAAHAAQPGGRITVVTAAGDRLAAEIVGRDEVSDVAVLRVAAPGPLVPVRLAPGPVEAGEAVAAIGDPLGYRATLTAGIVSMPRRAYGPVNPYDHIQHDAALNPGSSGGALVNGAGAVIGMNVAIADGSRRHVGIGLAIPAEVVARIADQIIRDGRIVRPELGLRLRDAASLGGGAPTPPLIEDVEAGGAAARAGLAPGMAVVAAGGRPLASPRDLARALEPMKPGEALSLTVQGEAGPREVRIALAAPPQPLARTRGLKPSAGALISFAHGVVLESGRTRIEKVETDSAAAAAGLKAGDEVVAVGTRTVDGASAREELIRASGTRLALLVRRDGVSRYVVLGSHGRIDSAQPFGANAEAEGSSRL